MDLHSGLFPKIEKTTFDVSVVHFLLMFGYKLFSLYYPLFLVSIGLSVINVGWVYLLIYGTISVASFGVNLWIHKIHPAKTVTFGILGYGIYALLMLFNPGIVIFYASQVLLGISAALWLVSLKSIIIESRPKNFNSSFGWFYSAPEYASALAPAVGGLIIWKFGFEGVFALSVLIQLINAFYAYFKLRDIRSSGSAHRPEVFDLKKFRENYRSVFKYFKKDCAVSFALFVIFIALILGGVYRTYFVLFLKELNYGQGEIIGFISLLSVLFIPLSWIVIIFIGKISSFRNISYGVLADGIIFIIIGLWSGLINYFGMFMLLLMDLAAGLMVGSGKSGMMAKKFAKFKEEASTIDTIIVTLGPALGGILGGVVISYIGYQKTFLFMGIIVVLLGLVFNIFNFKRNEN